MTGSRQKEWIDRAPEDWKIDRLKDCFFSVVGGEWGDDPDDEVDGQDMIVLRVADFRNGSVKLNNLTTRRIKDSKVHQRLITKSSLLIEKSGGGENQWVGRVVYPGALPFKAICSNFIAKLETNSKNNAKFLNYIFAALYNSNVNHPHVRQTTGIQNLTLHHYLGVKVALPPLSEQERIAAFLDESCEAIDEVLKRKRKQLCTLDTLRKVTIQRAVTQGLNKPIQMKNSGLEWLGSIPAHWKVQKLKRVFTNVDYGISQSTQVDGIYPVLKMGNIVKGEIVFEKIEFVSDVASDLVLEENDLLYNRTNSLDQVAKVGIFRGERSDNVTFASYLVRLRANQKNHPNYLNYLLNTEVFLGLARKMAIPSVQQANLNPTRYCRLEIPVPPLAEQVEIASHLDKKSKEISEIEHRLNDQISTLGSFRKSLTFEYVTGKRRISKASVAKVESYV